MPSTLGPWPALSWVRPHTYPCQQGPSSLPQTSCTWHHPLEPASVPGLSNARPLGCSKQNGQISTNSPPPVLTSTHHCLSLVPKFLPDPLSQLHCRPQSGLQLSSLGAAGASCLPLCPGPSPLPALLDPMSHIPIQPHCFPGETSLHWPLFTTPGLPGLSGFSTPPPQPTRACPAPACPPLCLTGTTLLLSVHSAFMLF